MKIGIVAGESGHVMPLGIPTFVDKPLMPGLEGALELMDLADRRGAPARDE